MDSIQVFVPQGMLTKIHENMYVLSIAGMQTAIDPQTLKRLYNEIRREIEPEF